MKQITVANGEPAPEKLAYKLREAAEVLSISYPSAYRLVQRGLLKSSGAFRTLLIPKTEIERFLQSTLK